MVPNVQYGGDEVSAIVLDIGSHSTRAGYAGEDCPKTVFPTIYSTIPPLTSTDSPQYSHGNSLNLYRPRSIHSSPIQDGLITDWDAVSRIFNHTFHDRMRLEKLTDFPLLVTESSWNTKENREKMIELCFEQWDCPAFYSVDKAVMSGFASGKGSALVIDVGHELTSVVPIYDGFVLRKAIQKQPAAGSLLSDALLHTLKTQIPPIPIVPAYLVKSKQAVELNAPAKAELRDERLFDSNNPNGNTTESYHTAQELRIMHEFKEGVCEVLPSAWDQGLVALKPNRLFEFPDGFNTNFGSTRLSIPEILFNPSQFMPKEFLSRQLPPSNSTILSHPYSALQPLTKLIQNSLTQIDPDLHSVLLSNIVVTGGTSLIQGFNDRLNNELNSISGGGIKVKIHSSSSPSERIYSSWLGGSILASLGTFHQLWIGKDEYMEVGKSIVHRRGK